MPAPDAVFVFIKISYKIFYNRFRVMIVSYCCTDTTSLCHTQLLASALRTVEGMLKLCSEQVIRFGIALATAC